VRLSPIKRYQELARLVLTLATASAAFLVNLIVNPPEKHAPSDAAAKLLNAAPQAILFLCATVFFLLLFMTLLNFFTRIILTSITSLKRTPTRSVAQASIVAGSTPSC
jgi:di/tricarboxylate transporter